MTANVPVPWAVDSTDSSAPALGDLVAGPAQTWPDRPAISDGEVGYTFAEFERGARAVAAWLTEHGVGPGERVAILTEKRAVLPVLIVAVWKCGAVYSPLDGAEPPARLGRLLARLAPAVVIALDDRAPVGSARHFLGGSQLAAVLSGPAAEHRTVVAGPDDAAYLVWTSSPSGEPQGVEIGAGALLAYFRSHNQALRITPDSRVLSLAPFTVDVSLEDTLLPLSLGAFVYQFRNLPAGAIMRAVIARERITHLIAVSMLLAMITGDGRQINEAKLHSLTTVMTGAQICDPSVVEIWRKQLPAVRFLHAYGPPEATVFSVGSENENPLRDRGYLLGRPLPGVSVKIMRDGVEVAEAGAEGELWVGGDRLMRGYFDRPDETARAVVALDGVRYFRTGDVCSIDSDGALVFHRHADEGVTWLAGRRSYLEEIRRTALEIAGTTEAVVGLVRRGNRELIALLVRSDDRRVLAAVEEHLRAVLPDYLRPTFWVWSPASSTQSSTVGDERAAFCALGSADLPQKSYYFALSADGAVTPIEEVELCQQP